MPWKLRAASKTDPGRQREQNEDCPYEFISEEGERGLFIVADGMGGYRAGEVASKLAVEKIRDSLKHFLIPIADQATVKLVPVAEQETIIMDATRPAEQTRPQKTRKLGETNTLKYIEDQLKAAVRKANLAIVAYGEEKSSARGLGCTVTAALVQDDQAHIVNVGDSRTYLYRNGELKPLTRDHSLVQRLVEEKQIDPEDVYSHPQRNLIYRSLGAGHKNVDADVFHETLQSGDRLLLCCDGLWEMVRPKQIVDVLRQEQDLQRICDTLIDMANSNGGEDNITAVVVQVSKV